jgi:transposase InsO family protein
LFGVLSSGFFTCTRQLVASFYAVARNLVDLQFEETGPNQKWAADNTYVWIGEDSLFLPSSSPSTRVALRCAMGCRFS